MTLPPRTPMLSQHLRTLQANRQYFELRREKRKAWLLALSILVAVGVLIWIWA